MIRAFRKDIAKNVAAATAEGAGRQVVGAQEGPPDSSDDGNFLDNNYVDDMAEGVVLAAAWFTARMICQVSYKTIKSYREKKRLEASPGEPKAAFTGAYGGYVPAISAEDEANDESCAIPWATNVERKQSAAAPPSSWESTAERKQVATAPPGSWETAVERRQIATAPPTPWEATAECRSVEAMAQAPTAWATPVECAKVEPLNEAPSSLHVDDEIWIEELRAASNARARDNLRLLSEIQGLEEKVDKIPLEALYDKLRTAMKLLLEYQQNPTFHSAGMALQQAEIAAREVYTNERSLVLSWSALRIRIVITYLHSPKHSSGLEPPVEDKEENKRQCELYISNSLQEGSLEALCRKFLASRDSADTRRREQAEGEAVVTFDIILEVLSSVYMLEPFRSSQGPLPSGVPHIVNYALSAYCKSGLGNAGLYRDIARALQNWESTPERQELFALHCLHESTNGSLWICDEGWDNVLTGSLSSVYGVSAESGRVTKISLGSNNLEGKLPPELANLVHLEELALPGNKLYGKIAPSLWSLPRLRVVALHGNNYTVAPPDKFRPLRRRGASPGLNIAKTAKRCLGTAGTVETIDSAPLEVFKGEWFVCSWKITNTGGTAFPKGTKLSRGDEDSILGGAEEALVNPLQPGEEQTVTVMQQAPDFEAWLLQDEWALVGEGLDFMDQDEAKAKTPMVTVVERKVRSGNHKTREEAQTLANTVFVAARMHRHGSSNFSMRSSLSSQHSSSHGTF